MTPVTDAAPLLEKIRTLRKTVPDYITNSLWLPERFRAAAASGQLSVLHNGDDCLALLYDQGGYDLLLFFGSSGAVLPAPPRACLAELFSREDSDSSGQATEIMLSRSGFSLRTVLHEYSHSFSREDSPERYFSKCDAILRSLGLPALAPVMDPEPVFSLWNSLLSPFDLSPVSPEIFQSGQVYGISDPQGELCAAVMYEYSGSACISRHVAVSPGLQGRGIGKAIRYHGAGCAMEAGCRRIRTWISDDNFPSIASGKAVFDQHLRVMKQFVYQPEKE